VFLGLYVRLTITETPVFQEAASTERASESANAGGFRDHTKDAPGGHPGVPRDVRALLPDDGLRAGLGHERALAIAGEIPADAIVHHLFFRIDHSALRNSGGAGAAARLAVDHRIDFPLRFDHGADFRCRDRGGGGDDGAGSGVDGPELRAPRHGAFRTLSDIGALHGQLRFPSTSRESLGASLAPYIATYLAKSYGLQYVGYYLSTSAVLTFIGLLLIRETKDDDLVRSKVLTFSMLREGPFASE